MVCAASHHIVFSLAVADSLGSRPGGNRYFAEVNSQVQASVYMHHPCKRRTVVNVLLLRASSTSARRGSSKGQSISCQHFQITEVQERENIMASIQMPLKVETQQNEKAEDVEFEKTTNHLVIFDGSKPMPPTSLPTSVIVTSRRGPKPVTQSLFRKEKLVDLERRRNWVEPMSSHPNHSKLQQPASLRRTRLNKRQRRQLPLQSSLFLAKWMQAKWKHIYGVAFQETLRAATSFGKQGCKQRRQQQSGGGAQVLWDALRLWHQQLGAAGSPQWSGLRWSEQAGKQDTTEHNRSQHEDRGVQRSAWISYRSQWNWKLLWIDVNRLQWGDWLYRKLVAWEEIQSHWNPPAEARGGHHVGDERDRERWGEGRRCNLRAEKKSVLLRGGWRAPWEGEGCPEHRRLPSFDQSMIGMGSRYWIWWFWFGGVTSVVKYLFHAYSLFHNKHIGNCQKKKLFLISYAFFCCCRQKSMKSLKIKLSDLAQPSKNLKVKK